MDGSLRSSGREADTRYAVFPPVPSLSLSSGDLRRPSEMEPSTGANASVTVLTKDGNVVLSAVGLSSAPVPGPPLGQFKDENRSVLRDLVNYIEEESLGLQEKLRVIRCSGAFLRAFLAFVRHLQAENCFLLWLNIECIKDFWHMMETDTLVAELRALKLLYIDSNAPLFANISILAAKAAEASLTSGERPTLRVLHHIETEVQEMMFGNLQNARDYFSRLADDDPLVGGPCLRDLPSVGRGLSASRSKERDTSGRRVFSTMARVSEEPRGYSSAAYSDFEKLVINTELRTLYYILQTVRGQLEAADYTVLCRQMLFTCAPYVKTIPFCLHVASNETAQKETLLLNSALTAIEMPLTVDLLTLYFYEPCFANGQLFLGHWTACPEYEELAALSRKRAAGGKEHKLNARAVRAFAVLVPRLYQSLQLVPLSFRWMLRAIGLLKQRASSAVFVLVLSEHLLRGPAAAGDAGHYYGVLRNVLVKLVERTFFFESAETAVYNAFLAQVRDAWETFWAQWLPASNSSEMNAGKTMDEYANGVAVERLRGTSQFSEAEDRVLRILKAQMLRFSGPLADLLEAVVLDADEESPPPPPQQQAAGGEQPQQLRAKLSQQLATVLSTRMREFQAFLSKALCDEPLMFWTEASQNQLSAELCRSLFENFIGNGARCQIAFSRAAVEQMAACLGQPEPRLEELDACLTQLLAECSTMLHDSALEFLSSSEVEQIPQQPQQQQHQQHHTPPSSPKATGGGLRATEQRRKLSLSTNMMRMMPFKSKRKVLEEVAQLAPDAKMTFLMKRHRSELHAFLQQAKMTEELSSLEKYCACFDTAALRPARQSQRVEELIKSGVLSGASVHETMAQLQPKLIPVCNLFIAHLLGSEQE